MIARRSFSRFHFGESAKFSAPRGKSGSRFTAVSCEKKKGMADASREDTVETASVLLSFNFVSPSKNFFQEK